MLKTREGGVLRVLAELLRFSGGRYLLAAPQVFGTRSSRGIKLRVPVGRGVEQRLASLQVLSGDLGCLYACRFKSHGADAYKRDAPSKDLFWKPTPITGPACISPEHVFVNVFRLSGGGRESRSAMNLYVHDAPLSGGR
ncbi:hypothetical protein EVAR_50421_1 [Eumeta japonica]|uniref:Uncharacterized protein n=1 Tax=Eumeta variegata TaxID=151549 RepID=A0A4C1WTW9_EUMVA|nr:hypothetical protein EVAR_50421_1 [Eumeta japonica]